MTSTFNDFKLERNALAERVFPKLEQYCASEGFQFQAIELRWGVSTEAGLDHRTMRICFEELRRSQRISPQPIFLILSGNRYGWRPLPEEISQSEFNELVTVANSKGENKKPISGVHEKTAEQILKDWYLLDENIVTNGVNSEHKPEPFNYILQPRTQNLNDGRDYTTIEDENGDPQDTPDWIDIQDVLWKIINRAFPASKLKDRFASSSPTSETLPNIVRFQGSATEQEIWQGAFQVPDAAEHVVAWFRKIDNLDEFSGEPGVGDFADLDDKGKIDTNAQQAQGQLCTEISGCLQKK